MKQALDTRTKLLTQNPFSLMLELSIPAVLGMVVVGLYNFMDSVFVGQMVGSVQMGAVSISYPFTLINGGTAAMIGVGSASVLSRAIGKKDEQTNHGKSDSHGSSSVGYHYGCGNDVYPPDSFIGRCQRGHLKLG